MTNLVSGTTALVRSTCQLSGAGCLLALVSLSPSQVANAQVDAPSTPADGRAALSSEACADGVVLDDGTAETAYGWVPSVVDGRYTQTFRTTDFRSTRLDKVCVCWTRTREDTTLDFEVHVYPGSEHFPASRDTRISIPFSISDVPDFPQVAFYELDLGAFDLDLPSPVAHIGVAWDSSVDSFFFVCADQDEAGAIINGNFIDDRADGWASLLDTSDPIFIGHRALMIRATASEQTPVHTTGKWALVFLALLLVTAGMRRTYLKFQDAR